MSRSMILVLAAAALFSDANAAGSGLPYQLDSEAAFETGCFPPCECPLLIQGPVKGTFVLVPTDFDGLYQHYDVVDVDWRYANGDAQVRVTGRGRYKVGGEVAVQQQMTLDLAFDGGPPGTYDSGLVAGGGQFPRIDVDIALHGFFCHDSAFHVRAGPSTAGVEDTPGTAPLRARPNPFELRTEIDFAMPETGSVFAAVHELGGRRIRTLAAGERYGAGAQRLSWDGTRDGGGQAGGGIYFVVVRAAGRELRGAVVKVGRGR